MLPIDYKFECLDGNHRTVAISELASEDLEAIEGSHMLLNIVFEDDIIKIRQDFVDVNSNAKATTPSINTLFNSRDPLTSVVNYVMEQFNYIEETTDILATSISKNSKSIYTINNIKNTLIEISGYNSQSPNGAEKTSTNIKIKENKLFLQERAFQFFITLLDNYYINNCLTKRELTPTIREENVLTSGTGLIIASRVAGYIFKYHNETAETQLIRLLVDFDWSRKNPLFIGKLLIEGKILNSRSSISEISLEIISFLGLASDSHNDIQTL